MTARALISMPKRARRGEIIEIKTLISHPMESGFRTDSAGRRLPRHIIHRFVASYDGVEIFRADLHPAITADPFLSFTTIATQSGTLSFAWTEDGGATQTETASIDVE